MVGVKGGRRRWASEVGVSRVAMGLGRGSESELATRRVRRDSNGRGGVGGGGGGGATIVSCVQREG